MERLKASAYVNPQGVAMLSLLVYDGAGPLYGNYYSARYLGWRLAAVLDAIDHGPVMVTV